MSMFNPHKLSTCRKRVVFKKNGTMHSVPCGHCVDCLALKCRHSADMCKRESEAHRYTFFLTLTYDEKYVPKAILLDTEHDGVSSLDIVDITTRYYQNGKRKLNPRYNTTIGRVPCNWDNEKFRAFFAKAEAPTRKHKKPRYKYLRVLDKRDVQMFLKRLRLRIQEAFGEEVRHFTVGEYGTEYFRPHFHVLLFFNSPKVARCLRKLVNQSWSFGIAQCESAKSKDGCATYVAEYLNSYFALPSFLGSKQIAPFVQHSRYFGTAYYAKIAEHVYDNPANYFEKNSIAVDNKIIEFVPTSHGANVLYPRAYGFDSRDFNGLLQVYTIYDVLSRTYGSDNCSYLTKCVLVNSSCSTHNFIELLDIVPHSNVSTYIKHLRTKLFLKTPQYYENAFTYSHTLTDEDNLVFGRIYRAIHLSKHFCNFVCNYGDARTMLHKIKDFYNARSLYSLRQMYIQQQYYSELSNNIDNIDEHYYDIFYYIKPGAYDFHKIYDSNQYVIASNRQKDFWYSSKIKHRKMNDLQQMKKQFNFNPNEQ